MLAAACWDEQFASAELEFLCVFLGKICEMTSVDFLEGLNPRVYSWHVVLQVSSQHPYAEQYIGRPHVLTVDYNNSIEFDAAIREIMRTKVPTPMMHWSSQEHFPPMAPPVSRSSSRVCQRHR